MLHILWIIIKGILLLLGILSGVILTVLLLVLFCPLRYAAAAEKIEEDFKKTKLYVSVSWLFHGISLKIRMEEGNISSKILLFGISLDKFKRRKKKKFSKKTESVDVRESLKENRKETPKEPVKPAQESKTQVVQPQIQEEELRESERQENKKEESKKQESKARSILKKIQNVSVQWNWWKCFLENAKVKAAISSVKKELWKIIKHIFPKKLSGKITFGSEDPSVTGAVLAVLGMTMPLHKNCVEVTPLFDGTNLFQGTISCKGRIYAVVLLFEGLKVIVNKNVRYTIKYWKNKEES